MATDAREAAWDELMQLAATLEPVLAAAFIETLDRLTESYSYATIEDAITTGKLDTLIGHLAVSPQAYAPLTAGLADVVSRAATQVLQNLPERIRVATVAPGQAADTFAPRPKRPAARVGVVFDGYNPKAVEYVQQHSARLVQQVSGQVRESLRAVVDRGIRTGTGPAAMAREIKAFVGLTASQQQAVVNYRRMLENQSAEALSRELRDRRFDPTLARSVAPGGPKLTQAQIDAQVEAYRQRYLSYRAEAIARTEAITALNTGQKAAWAQVVSDGGVAEGDVRRYWHTARDERTCPTCLPIPRMNPDGVGLDETFKTPEGPVDGPTMHPHCRCTVFVQPFFR